MSKGYCKNRVTSGFAGTIVRLVLLRLPMKKHELAEHFFSFHSCAFMFAYEKNMTCQNNYIIFLFIHSELYICHNGTLIVSVISRDTS